MSGDFDRLLTSIGENYDYAYEFLKVLAWIRNPYKTTILSDLEKEYGVLTDLNVSEQNRRNYLASIVYAGESNGTLEYLEEKLINAGFAVQVHPNDPAVDPVIFGAGAGGELIVNSKQYDRTMIDARSSNKHFNYIFFIGGDATRDADGRLTSIDKVLIDEDRKEQFRTLVLKYKPLHSWAIALINDTEWFRTATGDNAEFDNERGYSNDSQTTGGYYFDE
jgi:hypothetical protein